LIGHVGAGEGGAGARREYADKSKEYWGSPLLFEIALTGYRLAIATVWNQQVSRRFA
jgi:hypothetical protein